MDPPNTSQNIPEGSVLRDDGCICPAPPPPKPCPFKLQTCPVDPRFPNANQTRHCYLSCIIKRCDATLSRFCTEPLGFLTIDFVDYQRCARLLGDYPGCMIFYRCYTALCPRTWYERWYDQMDKGTFPRKIYPPKPVIRPDPKKLTNVCPEEEEEVEPEDPC